MRIFVPKREKVTGDWRGPLGIPMHKRENNIKMDIWK
jgi:hypothetical protein